MNLTVDIGNSRCKVSVFDNDTEIETFSFNSVTAERLDAILSKYNIDAAIVCSVAAPCEDIRALLENRVGRVIELNYETPIPITNAYLTPETLGMDRLAAVIGAWSMEKQTPLLVIDAGSAITFDYLSADGVYKGGNIAPGAVMRSRALNEYTERLPLVSLNENKRNTLMGCDTHSAILDGIINGISFEIEGYIASLKEKNGNLKVFLTGGDAIFLEKFIKSAIFVVSNLTSLGLNTILNYNLNK
ncbi:MAG: type III pantothenate kinase [Paludibacteraceae bacterium]|nr:type III pantothenate kinase [Paludibacteraceae bacterium]